MSTSTPELWIEADKERKNFVPGDKLEVSILWALPEVPDQLEARLCWYTRGKGTMDTKVVETRPVLSPAVAGKTVFTFNLPEEPHSFSGKLISLTWAVEVVSEPGSRNARWEFILAPDGEEIRLTSIE